MRPLLFSFCYLSFVYGADKYHGVILIPEGLVENIPELYALLQVQIIYFFWKFMMSFISALEAVLLSVFFSPFFLTDNLQVISVDRLTTDVGNPWSPWQGCLHG